VLEFDGKLASVKIPRFDIFSITGVFPGLKVIRVAIDLDDCEGILQLLATVSRLRMGRSIAKRRAYGISCLIGFVIQPDVRPFLSVGGDMYMDPRASPTSREAGV